MTGAEALKLCNGDKVVRRSDGVELIVHDAFHDTGPMSYWSGGVIVRVIEPDRAGFDVVRPDEIERTS